MSKRKSKRVATGKRKSGCASVNGCAAAEWSAEVDGIRMDRGSAIEAAREYGYGGNDPDEALRVLANWNYEINAN